MPFNGKHTADKRKKISSSTPTCERNNPTYVLLRPNSSIRLEVREENASHPIPQKRSTDCKVSKRTDSNCKRKEMRKGARSRHQHQNNKDGLLGNKEEEEEKDLQETDLNKTLNIVNSDNKLSQVSPRSQRRHYPHHLADNLSDNFSFPQNPRTDGKQGNSSNKKTPELCNSQAANDRTKTQEINLPSSNEKSAWPFGDHLHQVILPSVKRVSFFRDAFFTSPRTTHDYRPEPKLSIKMENKKCNQKPESMKIKSNTKTETTTKSANNESTSDIKSKPQNRGRTAMRNIRPSKTSKQDFIQRNIKQVAEKSARKGSPSRSPTARKPTPVFKREVTQKTPQGELNSGSNKTTKQNSVTIIRTAKAKDEDFDMYCFNQADDVTDSDVTSTFEAVSDDSSTEKGNLGDQSLLDFRADWARRMNIIEKRERSARRIADMLPRKSEREKAIVSKLNDVIDTIGSVKRDMNELYDYFDHFDREEETLLQQMQRQLAETKKEYKILEYKITKLKNRQVDNSRVDLLEEELRLSRQVAVSLHWELQRNDDKQNKLEDENRKLRHRLVASECSQKVLASQVTALQDALDQMSLHAPSRVLPCAPSNGDESSKNSESEMHRQIQFMKEKEDMMVKRLVDVQTEKDTLKDELQQYRAQFGELAVAPPTGAGRHTDLKLRLKLAEDNAGLLARKVVELEMEKDLLTKQFSETKKCEHEELTRKPSVSDLQFLEDEVGALRHALEDMEKENNKLACMEGNIVGLMEVYKVVLTAELIAIKSRKLIHSSSSNTLSSPGRGIVISLSSDTLFREAGSLKESLKNGNGMTSPMHEHHEASQSVSSTSEPAGNYVRLHPLTYYRIPTGKIASPASPVGRPTMTLSLDGAWEMCNMDKSDDAVKSPQSNTNIQRSDTIWNIRPIVSTVDAGVDATTPDEWKMLSDLEDEIEKAKADGILEEEDDDKECVSEAKFSRSDDSSCKDGIHCNSEKQISDNCISEIETKSESASEDVKINEESGNSKPAKNSRRESLREPTSQDSFILEEMKKQLACVRSIAENMDNVVDGTSVELQKKNREILTAELKRIQHFEENEIHNKNNNNVRKVIRLDLPATFHYSEENFTSCEEKENIENDICNKKDLIKKSEFSFEDFLTPIISIDCSNLFKHSTSESSSEVKDSQQFEKSCKNPRKSKLQVLDVIVIAVVFYLLMSSLPLSVMLKISFLLSLFFVI